MGKAKREKNKAKKKVKPTRKIKKKKKKSVDTWKTKKWFSIIAPKNFESKELGQAITTKPESLIGRSVKSTLREITGNISHQNVKLQFKITNVKGQTAITELISEKMQRGYLSRQTKRMRSLVPAIFRVMTKDKNALQVTALAFGRYKMRIAQKKAMRSKMIELITAIAKKHDYNKFVQEAVYGKISAAIQKDIKKIFPVQRIEVVKIRLLSSPKLGKVLAAETVVEIEEQLPEEPKEIEEQLPEETDETKETVEEK